MTPLWTFPAFRFDQPIAPLPGWFQTVVNYQGDASIEKKVTEEVASFGKQLGIISEASSRWPATRGPDPSWRGCARSWTR